MLKGNFQRSGHRVQNEYMSPYPECHGHDDDSHFYAELIGVETGPTPENVKTPIKKSETTKSSVIQVRLCSFIVLVAVLLSTGITAVGFMTFNNTRTTDKIDHAECGKVNQEPLSDENDSISVLRSTCPIGWSRRGDSCYNLYEERKTWFEARHHCLDAGAELISIHGSKKSTLLSQLMEQKSGQDYWIGLNDLNEEGKFVWSDGSRTDFTQWHENEPNNYNQFEHCAEVKSGDDKTWNDANCYLRRGFICKMKLTDRCGDNGDWLLFNNHCYLFVESRQTWYEAKMRCLQKESDLITINSSREREFIYSQATTRTWIGLRRFPNSGVFRWADGQDAGNLPWGRWNPRPGQDCVYIGGHGNYLSLPCENEVDGYICEKPVN